MIYGSKMIPYPDNPHVSSLKMDMTLSSWSSTLSRKHPLWKDIKDEIEVEHPSLYLVVLSLSFFEKHEEAHRRMTERLVGKVFSPNKRHVGGSFADFTVIKPREYFTKLHTIAHVRETHEKLIASTLITWVILNERNKSNWLSFFFLFSFISTFIVSTYMAAC